MNKILNPLDSLHTVVTRVQTKLKALLDTYCFKFVIRPEYEEESQRVKRKVEDEHDLIAYSDSINSRTQLYFKLSQDYLQLYFQEKHSVRLSNAKKCYAMCQKLNIINAQEAELLSQLADFIPDTAYPDREGNYIYTDRFVSFTVVMSKIINHLHPKQTVLLAKPAKQLLKKPKQAIIHRSVETNISIHA